MQNAEENLNTESNDIAGNRLEGPAGNTAAQPNGGPGMGQPRTAAPVPAAATDPDNPAALASSESLAASETSVGQGAVDGEAEPQENKEANPDDLQPADTYGGNFSNSTQGSYRDEDRRENQDSDPNRGEFGIQQPSGTTHGGYGNQFREGITEHQGPADDKYYGQGVVRPESGDLNSYRAYDGRDERPDARTAYGFEAGTTVSLNPNASTALPNDNGSPLGTDSGYADDYGTTSLRATPAAGVAGQHVDTIEPGQRNQTEDYMPSPGAPASQGRPAPNAGPAPADPEASGSRPADSRGYGDRGRDLANEAPDMATGDDRNGYNSGEANKGDASKGIGSKGGSYNDQYDDSQPNSRAGSPAKGEERSEDRSQNYGSSARAENRSAEGDDSATDHGAPQRNAGRDGVADE